MEYGEEMHSKINVVFVEVLVQFMNVVVVIFLKGIVIVMEM